jgi:hypothetical protein
MLASLSSFAFVLARLVSLIALDLSFVVLSSSERRDAVIVCRLLICSESFAFNF